MNHLRTDNGVVSFLIVTSKLEQNSHEGLWWGHASATEIGARSRAAADFFCRQRDCGEHFHRYRGRVVVAMLIVIPIGIFIERKISLMPLVTLALVLVFGGLTLWMSNDIFIKIKPTVLYVMFAGVLLGGLAFSKLFIKLMLGQTLRSSRRGMADTDVALGDLLHNAGYSQ